MARRASRGVSRLNQFTRIFQKFMGPMFGIIALDAFARSVDSMLLNPSTALKIPYAGRAAISLTFNLMRLKITSMFAKGLPFGLGTFAVFAARLSALQIALGSLPVFLNPENYKIPTQSGVGVGYAAGLEEQPFLER